MCFFGALPAEAKEKTEYGSSYSEVVNTPAGIDKVFAAFPESSRDQLKELLKNHSNWKFQAFYTSLDWEELFDWSFKLYDTNGESEMYYGRNLLEGRQIISAVVSQHTIFRNLMLIRVMNRWRIQQTRCTKKKQIIKDVFGDNIWVL